LRGGVRGTNKVERGVPDTRKVERGVPDTRKVERGVPDTRKVEKHRSNKFDNINLTVLEPSVISNVCDFSTMT
jgi:hypothetical protein